MLPLSRRVVIARPQRSNTLSIGTFSGNTSATSGPYPARSGNFVRPLEGRARHVDGRSIRC
jgi:hypothetical protein